MELRQTYYGVFDYSEETIYVFFPDIPGCYASGETPEDAVLWAKEALEHYLYTFQEIGLPNASAPDDIALEEDQKIMPVEAVLDVIESNGVRSLRMRGQR
ncbi:MAG: type II toxin-antitoxin system HicB family antitoxin [Solirubrobacterales bacterium]